MIGQGLPPSFKAFVAREFAGERLLWAARPDRRIAALWSCGIWLFAVPWTVFSLFWISVPLGALYEHYSGETIGAPKGAPIGMMWVFAIFGTPFLLLGLAMLLSPLDKLREGCRTLFVLTDRRLAILEGARQVKVTSIHPHEITGLARKEGPDGRGTLIVHQGYERDSDGGRVAKQAEFGVIDGVRAVEEMVRSLKDEAS